LALWLFAAAYLLPGLFGRDPWRTADITAFGYMFGIAEGKTPWLAPTVGGLPADSALLPYWLGAAFIKLLTPWVEPAFAARIPFAILLGLVLLLTWYTTYHLARTDAAQPLPFAFGGEASPTDYARAIADGGLLALIATLGLLQLGHETTPELGQLASVSLFIYALAASPYRELQSRLAVLAALPALAASGAPSVAAALAITGSIVCGRSSYAPARRFAVWIIASGVLAVILATVMDAWGWRLATSVRDGLFLKLLRQWAWFLWPAWPLALWTLWRWRAHWLHRHIAIPLGCALVSLVAGALMGGSDRALMLALPPLAVLAAFALPTLQRSTAAAIDWFSVFFFSICALVIWVIYVAMQTGIPAKPAANVARLAPGFVPSFSFVALLAAVLASLAWMWLVQWRAGRNRHPLWKSLVLPASGVALCWMLLMTLWLPPLDYAFSYRALVTRISQHVPADACVAAPGMSRSVIVALETLGRYHVDAVTPVSATTCKHLLVAETRQQAAMVPAPWTLVARERRPTDGQDVTAIYRRD
jgi:4-amino-4-deoxy-L-arabinose transferase-like glycosyltransferase